MIENRKTAVTYQGDGNTSVFPFSFAVTDANSVRVSIYDKETDVSTELTRDYFVDTAAHVVHYPGYAPGESVDAHAQPPKLPRGKNITIYRITPIDQLTDLGNKYPLPYIETMADKLTAILQEHDEMFGRTVTLPAGDPKTPEQRLTDLQAYVLDAKNAASAADQSARSAGDSKAFVASSASASAQSAAASEASRQASAVSESNIKTMQVDVHAMQSHVDEVKTAIDGVAAQTKADGQTASEAALQAQNSAEASVQSAAASEEAAKRAEAAARFDGVVQSENLAEKSVHKKHLHQDAYESPALTGIPTAPTANKGTSNQQIANTAFVANGLADKFDKTGGVINPAASDEGYTEGIRIATAPNNWSTFILGCKPNTYEGNQTKTGGWGFFRTPANELIIGNRDCMADSAAVVFGSDQKAYFKQMVYAPDFFAYVRCYAQDAFVTTGDGGLYLQKWGGGWYMRDGTWIRAYGNKNVYTGGAMRADGGFEGNLRGRADATNGIAILTGTIAHGGTIPLPDGYTESQCRWMVSIASENSNSTKWVINASSPRVFYQSHCYTNGRTVYCLTYVWDNFDRKPLAGIANYMVIGVK